MKQLRIELFMADEIIGNPSKLIEKPNRAKFQQENNEYISKIEINQIINKTQLKKVINIKKKTLQTKLFETDINRLKIDNNIQFFLEFWNQYYPDIYNEHLALDYMHTTGIADDKSSIIKKRAKARFDLNLHNFLPIFQRLGKIMKNGKYDDIKIEIFSKSLMKITPLDYNFSIIIDIFNNLEYKSKYKKFNKPVKKELYSELWGSSYIPLNSSLLQKKNNDGSSFFIRLIGSKSLEKKILTHSLRYEGFYSIENINSIFETLLEFERFQKKSLKNIENNLINLEIYFSDGYLKFNPKFSQKRKNQWFIFLAARKE